VETSNGSRTPFVLGSHPRDGRLAIRRPSSDLGVLARREGRSLYAEVKGATSSIGLDVDTAYGQLLRRMPAFRDERVRYALVVPERAESAALRVPARVREALRIDVYVVDEDGGVRAGLG
jgi:hypothetical protein